MTSYSLQLWQFQFADNRLTNLCVATYHRLCAVTWHFDPWFLWQPASQSAQFWAWKMTLMKDNQEGQLHGVCTVTYCTRYGSCVGSDTRIGSWNMSTYCMYTSTDMQFYSCLGKKNVSIVWYTTLWQAMQLWQFPFVDSRLTNLVPVTWHFDLTVDHW